MSRKTGLVLQNAGMLLITAVMMTDRFLFELNGEFIFVCTLMSAFLLIIGISMLKKKNV